MYCDNHMLIGDGRRSETMVSDIALRQALVMVLDATAFNEKKLITWQQQYEVLGLIFDFDSLTVTTPASKLTKIMGCVFAPFRLYLGLLEPFAWGDGFVTLPRDVCCGS
jgi:hypothetical protein